MLIPIRSSVVYEFAFRTQYIKEEKRVYGLIVLRNKSNKEDYEVSILSQFLADKYTNASIDTERKRAYQLIKFLNYLLESSQIELLSDINFAHGKGFFSELKYQEDHKKKGKSTIQEYEKVVTDFYMYLLEKGLIDNTIYQEFISPLTGELRDNPFNIVYPEESERNILHDIPEHYIPLFLRIAERVANCIAFGIYLQIYGGLRVAEVVSLRFEDISMMGIGGEYGFKVILQRGKIIRSDLKNDVVSTVKVTRDQQVDPINAFSATNKGLRMFYHHVETYSKDKNALFINPRNTVKKGEAMTRKNYARYFNRIKNAFCKELIDNGDLYDHEYGKFLRKVYWSTHIGRGIFTNMKARTLKNAAQLQHVRGDKSPESAIDYFEISQVIEKSKAAQESQIDFIRSLAKQRGKDTKVLKEAIAEVRQIVEMENMVGSTDMDVVATTEDSVSSFFLEILNNERNN
mgnify:CR=1 FL=1|jgi:hypothetical protein